LGKCSPDKLNCFTFSCVEEFLRTFYVHNESKYPQYNLDPK
jgi:hypothetical protein